MKATFRFEGGRELEAALAQLGSNSTRRRTAERALNPAAEPIRDEAVRLAPEDEGNLKERIKIGKASRRNRNRDKDVAEVFVGIEYRPVRFLALYASIDEFGGADQAAQPYMRPAFESRKQQAVSLIADNLRTEIGIAAARLAKRQARKAAKG